MSFASIGRSSAADIITIKVGPVLTAHKLRRLSATIETMYGVFLVLFWIGRARGRDAGRDDYHFIAEELVHYFLAEPKGIEITTLLGLMWHPAFREQQSELLSILTHKLYDRAQAEFEHPKERTLRIAAAHISSPGAISFEGLGEPLREVRELIKDLWYRNSQERRQGELVIEQTELKIAREHLALNAQYRDLLSKGTPGPVDMPTLLLGGATQDLNALEREGVVEADIDALDQELR
jgi:hypothetical protein